MPNLDGHWTSDEWLIKKKIKKIYRRKKLHGAAEARLLEHHRYAKGRQFTASGSWRTDMMRLAWCWRTKHFSRLVVVALSQRWSVVVDFGRTGCFPSTYYVLWMGKGEILFPSFSVVNGRRNLKCSVRGFGTGIGIEEARKNGNAISWRGANGMNLEKWRFCLK